MHGHSTAAHRFDGLCKMAGICSKHGSAGVLLALHGAQFVWCESCRGQRLAHDVHAAGDVDAHRTDHAATAALGATVEAQRLPFPQIIDIHIPGERFPQPGQGGDFASPDAPQQIELVRRNEVRVIVLHAELAGVGAIAASHATLEIDREVAIHFFEHDRFGTVDTLRVGHLDLRCLLRQMGDGVAELCIHLAIHHARTPRRAMNAPNWARPKNQLTVWNSLPKGNHTSSNSSDMR